MESFQRNMDNFLYRVESCELVPDSELFKFLLETDASNRVVGQIIQNSYSIQRLLPKKREISFPKAYQNDYQNWKFLKPILLDMLNGLLPRPRADAKELKIEIDYRFSASDISTKGSRKKLEEIVALADPKEVLGFLNERKVTFPVNSWPYYELGFMNEAFAWVEQQFMMGKIRYVHKSFLISGSIFWFVDFFEAYEFLQADFLG